MFLSKLFGLTITVFLHLLLLDKANLLDFKFQQNDYQMKFERCELVRFNKDYMKSYKLTTFKYNRTAPVLNYTIEYSVDVGYDIEIIIQAYVFLSNEYRLYPIHFEVNFCEAFTKNYIGLGGWSKCGNFTGCPIVKGRIYHICNWAPDQSQFPPLIPDGKYMLEMQGIYHDVEVWLIRGYGIIDRPIKMPFDIKL